LHSFVCITLLIPVGLSVWPASIILSQWVAARGNGSLAGKSVLELGAGCGLPAIVAGKLVVACLPAVFVLVKCNLTSFFTTKQSLHCVFVYIGILFLVFVYFCVSFSFLLS
jgi:hypothetical protein